MKFFLAPLGFDDAGVEVAVVELFGVEEDRLSVGFWALDFCSSISILEIFSFNDATRCARSVLSTFTSSVAATLTTGLFGWLGLLLLLVLETLALFD